ncbi:MAG: phosphatase PAP2 family protein [Gemmatimonadota bacterium]|nr:phosphatase PAP2 family protein [Gemmatimonadota bacterium]
MNLFKLGAALIVGVSPVSTVAAQSLAASDTASAVVQRGPSLVRGRDLFFAAGLGAAIAAAMSADRSVQRSLQRPTAQSNGALKGISNLTGGLGDPGSVIISAGLYFAGLASHSRRTAALGMHTGESVVLGGLISEMVKSEIGRARPKYSPNDSHLFRAGKGFSDDHYASLPSTETTVSFAAATALSLGIDRDWPGHARVVTPVAYSLASAVAFSRLYKNEHWLSDVVAGGGLGIASAVLVDRFNRRYSGNVFEKWFLPTSLVPARGGFAVAWSR